MTPFDGSTYSPELDGKRLSSALGRMAQRADGCWRPVARWAEIGECQEAAAGARLRDFNKAEFKRFGLQMESKRGNHSGLWLYRLSPRPVKPGLLFDNSRRSE